jgi:hypothetical protein
VPLFPPQIPHDLIRARTRAAMVVSRRLTAWATVRPNYEDYLTSRWKKRMVEIYLHSPMCLLGVLLHQLYLYTALKLTDWLQNFAP